MATSDSIPPLPVAAPGPAGPAAKDAADASDDRKLATSLRICAAAFFVVALASLAALVVITFARGSTRDEQLMVFVVAGLSALIGFVLTRVARNGAFAVPDSLSKDARDLLGDQLKTSSTPIQDWTTLVGLTGGTGVFRKLELAGMPLATIAMTLIFALLGLVAAWLAHDASEAATGEFHNASSVLFDMSKLTLGAFIGSFVTKTSSRDIQNTQLGAAAGAAAIAAVGGISGGAGDGSAKSAPSDPAP